MASWEEWWRVALLALGGLLLAGTWMIEPDEERGLRNKLVDWWIHVTESRETAKGKLVALSQAIAQRILQALDRIFGTKLLSFHFLVGSSLVTSMAGALWMALTASLEEDPESRLALYLVIAYFAASTVVLWRYTSSRRAVWLLLVPLLHSSLWLLGLFSEEERFSETWPFLLAADALVLLGGAPVDLLNVPATRFLLRRAVESQAAALWLCLMFFVPLLFAVALWEALPHLTTDIGAESEEQMSTMLTSMSAGWLMPATSLNVLLSLSIVTFVVLLAFNAGVWSVISRSLHALHDRGPSRVQLSALGWLLIGTSVATHPYAHFWKKLDLPEPNAETQPNSKAEEGSR